MAENNRQRRFFPDAFKLEAVAAIRGGRSVSAVAAELGLLDRLVRAWLRWAEGHTTRERRAGADARQGAGGAGAPRGPGPGGPGGGARRLRRELDLARMKRDILGKAALIFGRATGRRRAMPSSASTSPTSPSGSCARCWA